MKFLAVSPDLSLPIDAATQTFAFIARKGAGKTYAAGKLTELLLDAKVQVVVIDTVGNGCGLRLAADGKGKGFDVPVFGGLRGDLPLQAQVAAENEPEQREGGEEEYRGRGYGTNPRNRRRRFGSSGIQAREDSEESRK